MAMKIDSDYEMDASMSFCESANEVTASGDGVLNSRHSVQERVEKALMMKCFQVGDLSKA